MKFSRMASLVCLLCLFPFSIPAQAADSLRISSTIGPVDAGILPLLADTFSQKTGITISMEKAGTGKTLKKAESGAFDLVMVHARKLEDAFVAAGFGVDRRDVMYNDFVILGPAGDPAGIKGMKSAAAAFAAIARAGAPFVSRGDRSGTHVKEMDIWQAAGIQPAGAWYEVYADGAKGNKATTLYTDRKQAYTLMDRATWLTLKDTVTVVPLVENDPIMLNLIAIIRVNPDKFPQVHKDAALKFADWLVGDEAQTIIRDFPVLPQFRPVACQARQVGDGCGGPACGWLSASHTVPCAGRAHDAGLAVRLRAWHPAGCRMPARTAWGHPFCRGP